MRIDLYLGPSLEPAERDRQVAQIPAEVRVWPPVRRGDLIRRFDRLPDVIAILDGVFFQEPSVYHKEILAAIEAGARVVGASSMGALRAAELDRFGMYGLGAVYRLYRRGVIDGDDMVALAHAEAEDDFRPLSVPLVNIRHNVLAATRQAVIDRGTARAVLRAARALFFPSRSWSVVLGKARQDGVDPVMLAALREYLRTDEVDLKRDDAIRLLRFLARYAQSGGWPGADVRPRTAGTTYFLKIIGDYAGHEIDGRHVTTSLAVNLSRLLDDDFPTLVRLVNERCLAVDEARARGLRERPETALPAEPAPDGPWSGERYLSREELLAGLAERDLQAQLYELLEHAGGDPAAAVRAAVSRRTGLRPEELRRRLLAHPGIPWDQPLVRELKLRGSFGTILRRAKQVLDLNAAFDVRYPSVRARLTDDGLTEWFARRWAAAPGEGFTAALHARGFLNRTEFLETARVGYVFDWMRSGKSP